MQHTLIARFKNKEALVGIVGLALYEQVTDRLVPVSCIKVAEMTKLLENIYRTVNIGLVNELKIVADARASLRPSQCRAHTGTSREF